MANPRKFSEKIALLNQKQAEGNAEFERIMREVSEVSAKVAYKCFTVTRSSLLVVLHMRTSSNPENAKRKKEEKNYSHLRSENLRCSEKKLTFVFEHFLLLLLC